MVIPLPEPLTTGCSHFFGFHDLTPWNAETDELVCLSTDIVEDHVPTHTESANVVIINGADGKVEIAGKTYAWNWQMGARQRWLPAIGRRVIAYNASDENGLHCRIVDLDRGEARRLPMALFDICDHQGFGLAVNFLRLYTCQPGYGYDHPSRHEGASFDYKQDGVFRVDLATGETKLILSIADFLRQQNLDTDIGDHYFTHLQISPDGRRFIVMHRCYLKSGGLVNHMVVVNADGSDVRVLLDDKISHYDWSDSGRVLVWCRRNAAIKKLKESKLFTFARVLYRISRKIRVSMVRQAIYNESFREIDVDTGSIIDVGKGILTEDGHPQVNPVYAGIWINDTYPNPDNIQTLIVYHQPTNRRVDLLQLRTQVSIQETCWRCDFHPRWHPSGKMVCIDSAHNGRRQLVVLDVYDKIQELI